MRGWPLVLVACTACKGFFDVRPDCDGSAAVDGSRGPVQFIQANETTDSKPSATVAFPLAQRAGDVVVAMISTGAPVTSVTDTSGNAYLAAIGPQGNLSIYVAVDIRAAGPGGNAVTFTLAQSAGFSLRILEYAGLDSTAPVDTGAGMIGSVAVADSGPITTTHAHDLIVAGDATTAVTVGAGPGFTSRILTGGGEIVEDEEVQAIGTYHATAPLNGPANWSMAAVALRAAD